MNKKRIYITAYIILTLLFILPYLGVIFYTLPRNDEFAGAFSIVYHGGEYSLRTFFKCVARIYMVWEGNYSGVFFYTMLNPIVLSNSDFSIYAMNIICFLIFIAVGYYIIFKSLKLFDIASEKAGLLAYITLIMCMNCRFLRETLGWFTGYMYYTFQLMTGTLGLILAVSLTYHPRDKKWKNLLLALVVVVLECIAAGGTLQITAIMCWCSLLFMIWTFYSKSPKIYSLILFASSLTFALVNVAAPGHRVRNDGYEQISLIKAIIYTVICVLKELRQLFTTSWFPYAMFVLFIVLFFIINPVKGKLYLNPVIVLLAGLGCIFISTFPVCYGYSSSELASRGYEIMDMLIVVAFVLFLCSLVNIFKCHEFVPGKETMFTLIAVFVLILSTIGFRNIEVSQIPVVQCVAGLASGEVREYSNYWRNVLNTVRHSDESEVIITVDSEHMNKECMIDRVMFQTDETNWVNNAAALYYGKTSIRLVVE